MRGQDQLHTTQVDDREGSGPSAAAVPAVVGRYRIRDRVGAGGMGVVFRGRDPELHRDVAIKLLRPRRNAGTATDRQRARLLREARAMAQLSHPNVVPVFDVGPYGDGLFVAMQYVPGPNARQWLEREQPKFERVLGVFRAAGRGLAAAHAAGLVHRDFKPANVIVGDDGRVRVLDFGLARAMADITGDPDPDAGEDVTWSEAVTSAGVVVGTPMYMAPEQFTGGPVDARADQYAFCVSLYEGMYGRVPFAAASRRELGRHKVEHRLVDPPADTRVPARLFRIIERGTRPRPADRYPGMPDVLRELRGVAEAGTRRADGPGRTRSIALALACGLAGFGIGRATLPTDTTTVVGSTRDARETAYFAAVAAGDARAAATAAIELMELGGPELPRWQRHAQAHLQAAGAPDDLTARLQAALP